MTSPAGGPAEILGIRLDVPDGWRQEPVAELPTHREVLVRGGHAEGLLVQHMADADPAADLARWAYAPIHLAGAPAVTLAVSPGQSASVREWEELSPPAGVDVDELRVFQGVASVAAADQRVIVVVARRGRDAWNVGLALRAGGDAEPGDVLGDLRFG